MSAQNSVRISAGIWRSRLLQFPSAQGLRPTPDRVRQTLFNWLGQDLTGLRCLDLFAGSGVLGFESLSRGASSVVMVDAQREVYQALNNNLQTLQRGHPQPIPAQIVKADALQFLASCKVLFDVMYIDPPYHQDWLSQLLPIIPAHLAPGGFLYVEAESALSAAEGLDIIKTGRAGRVYYHLLKAR